jgi:hypothetical protein
LLEVKVQGDEAAARQLESVFAGIQICGAVL